MSHLRLVRAAWLAGCAVLLAALPAAAQSQPLCVLATTSLIADVARQVAGDWLTVDTLLPPDTDGHAFQPDAADAMHVAGADLLLVNGAGYETFLQGLLDNASADVPVVTVSDGIAIAPLAGDTFPREPIGLLGEDGVDCADGLCDPHVWMNPQNVMIWTANIADAFAALDPAHAEAYQANAEVYIEQLTALDEDLQALVETLPEGRRLLVTNHEFLGYFADRYGFTVIGTILPGGSSLAETDPQALADLIATTKDAGVAAIFVEVTASDQVAATVAEDAGVTLVSSLYAESLSDQDGPAATYIDFMRFNTQTIVDALVG